MDRELTTNVQHGLHGTLQVPGDKSISHRAIMLASLAEGMTVITNFLTSRDCISTQQAFRDLGVSIQRTGTEVVVYGAGMHGLKQPAQSLAMNNSGTTTRLMMGLLAWQDFDTRLTGDESLSARPMARVAKPLAAMGATIDLDHDHLPATIHGQKLHGADIQLEVASAQVKSALILAALQADSPTTIHELLPTRDHTETMLQALGADVSVSADKMTITVQPTEKLVAHDIEVPGDMSSAAFFMVAATLVPNSDITLTNVGLNPTRRGLLDVLIAMGGDVQVDAHTNAGEALGDIRVRSAKLHPIELGAEQIPAIIDELPLVALLAAKADGISRITGAEELRVKETDRIKVVASELAQLGVKISELPDGFVIDGRGEWAAKTDRVDSHGDHRVGMMLGLAALLVKTPLALADADSVGVSYPAFFGDLKALLEA